MELAPRAAAAGVRLTVCDTVDSTNAEALARARGGEAGPRWITAGVQTAGRGRRGRDWVSTPGNLHASLLLTDPAPIERAAQVSFVAALAVHDALARVAPGLRTRLALKWPNDVLCDAAKLAGILIESEGRSRLSLVIGIGVNVGDHPANTEYPATDIAANAIHVTAEAVFAALSGTMLDRLIQWDHGNGFSATRADWLARAAGRGGNIRVRLADAELTGRFTDLDECGRLLLTRADGSITTVAAGDVFPIAAARPADNR